MNIVDAQVHIWAADTPERPWPKGGPAKPQRPGVYLAEDLLAELDEGGVNQAIVVPPSWEGDRNDLALAAARDYPDRLAVMGRLDVHDPNARENLANWRRQPGMLGIRLTVRTEEEIRFVTDRQWDWIWAQAAESSVPIMFFPYGHLHHVEALASRHPDVKLTIDHLAAYRTQGPAAFADLEQLISLARHPNISVKASAVPFYSAQPYPFADTHDVLHRVFDAYGPQRMFWGSDITRQRCPLSQVVRLFTEELPWLHGEDLAWVMGRGVQQWLGW